MPDWLILLALFCVCAWFLRDRFKPPPAFQIRFYEGRPQVITGKVTQQFLKDLTRVVVAAGLRQGTLTGLQQTGRIVLKFSREFPEPVQQQIRNMWICGP